MQVTQIYLSDNGEPPPRVLQGYIASVRRSFSHLPHVVYDNEMVRGLIGGNFGESVLGAYDKLRPYAYKSDLGRYCIVYVVGGWYFDVGLYCPFPGPGLERRISLVAFREDPLVTPFASWAVAGGLFYAHASHPALKKAIDRIVSNCKSNYYGSNPLCPTGPSVWGRAVCELTPRHGLKNRVMVLPNGKIVALYKPTHPHGYRHTFSRMGAIGCNDYNELWNRRRVYQGE
ncbi:MAG: hypothetical protein ACKOXO_13000 [Cyanobium sp.]